jgi:hypothetical protein
VSGSIALDAFIQGLDKLGSDFTRKVAKESEMLVATAVRAQAAAGTDAEGKVWPSRKDGSRAMPKAAEYVWVDAKGPVVVIKVKSRGAAIQGNLREDRRRRILPDSGKPLPREIVAALQEGAMRAFDKAMGGT